MTETPERAIELLKTFVDDDPCRLDHHGNCQTHSLGNPCNVAEAREFLASLGEPALSEAEADAIFAAAEAIPVDAETLARIKARGTAISDLEAIAARAKRQMDALPEGSPLRAAYFKLLSLTGQIQAVVSSREDES